MFTGGKEETDITNFFPQGMIQTFVVTQRYCIGPICLG